MGKVKVYELAKELGLTNNELIEKLTILTYDESLKLENEMNNNGILIGKFKNDINSLQEQIKTYEESTINSVAWRANRYRSICPERQHHPSESSGVLSQSGEDCRSR